MPGSPIIAHRNISYLIVRIINLLGAEIEHGGQCFWVASLALIAMRKGKAGRERFTKLIQLMMQLDNLSIEINGNSDENNSIIDLIEGICNGQFLTDSDRSIKQTIGSIDCGLLRDLPIICLYFYMYSCMDKVHPLSKFINDKNQLMEQNFIKISQALQTVVQTENLVENLNDFFPNYPVFDKLSLVSDFKRIHETWGANAPSQDETSHFSVGQYLNSELKLYFERISFYINHRPKSIQTPIQFLLFTNTHAFSVGYDLKEKKWYIADSLILTEQYIVAGLSNDSIAKTLPQYHFSNDSTGFTALIHAEKTMHDYIKTELAKDRIWIKLHNYNRDELIGMSNRAYYQRNIIDCVIESEDQEAAIKLINSKHILQLLEEKTESKAVKQTRSIFLLTHAITESNLNFIIHVERSTEFHSEFDFLISSAVKKAVTQIEYHSFRFIKKHDVTLFQLFLNHALIAASRLGNLALVSMLLIEGADLRFTSTQGETAIIAASNNDQDEMLFFLLQRFTNKPNWVSELITPFLKACESGHARVVTVFLKLLSTTELDIYIYNLVNRAAKNWHKDVIKLILSKGVNVDTRDFLGRSPLMSACKRGDPEIVASLLSANADIYAKDNMHWTAKMYAELYYFTPIEKLIEAHHLKQEKLLQASSVTSPLIKLSIHAEMKHSALGKRKIEHEKPESDKYQKKY